MSEPLASAQGQAQQDTLWDKAPAWRGLVLGATLLSVGALGVPLLFPEENAAPLPDLQTVQSTPAVVLPPAPLPAPAQTPQRLASLAPRHAAPLPATPQPLPAAPASQPAQTVCLLVGPNAPVNFGSGTVMQFEDHATSLARIQATQAHNNGKIDPAYIDNLRVHIRLPNGAYQVVLVPAGMTPNIGDRVMFQGSYRNTALPCNYVPVLITRDLGPAPPGEGGAPPPPPGR